MNFNTRQTKVINAEDNKILCLATAACGKTRVMTERIRVLVQEKGVKPSEIVAITFTNMAAEEMKKRLSIALGNDINGAFIGTIHSYANYICGLNKVDTKTYIANENYDELIRLAMKIPKANLPKIAHLLIDECQDLSPLEYSFFQYLIVDNIFYVGDNRQSIYGFRGCTDNYLVSMSYDPKYTKYYLNQNYRNAPNIMQFADSFLTTMQQLSPKSQAVKTQDGYINDECTFYEALEDLIESGNWGSWFILTRTNKELDRVMEVLTEKEIPCVTFKKSELSTEQLEQIMASNRVKVLTIHMSKGLERDSVIVIGAKTFNLDERKIAYVAATRAMRNLYWCPTIVKRGQAYKKRTAFNQLDNEMVEF